jgi:acylphosphatase
VYGRVQGVFFRTETRARARSLGVAGWVLNVPDGSLEAIFEGRPEAVDSMVAWCGRGPSGAAVERLETQDEEPEGETVFSITP